MAEHFSKTYKSPEDLVKLLMSRGLQVSNEAKAAAYIRNIGYFRLSAYFYPFLKKPKNLHQYKKRSSFNKVLKLYRFDRKLRLIMFNEIEKIEVAIRSTMVNIVCAETNDPFWMTNARYFASSSEYRETMKLIKKEYDRSREDFIKHFKQKYSEPYPPAWELVEILPLGVITRIYGNIRDFRIQKMIAKRFYLNIPVFESWMTILTLTRNSCCHHARVWNREYTIKALRMKKMQRPWINNNIGQNRVFYNLTIIKYFLDIISPSNHLKQNLLELFKKYPSADKKAMGFPGEWGNEPLWK